MIGLGKLLENKKEVIGLARVLLEQAECYPEDFFTVDGEVLEPGIDDSDMLVKVKAACSDGDECASSYFQYYKNNRSEIEQPSECNFSVEGEEDTPEATWDCKDEGAASEEELVTWAYDNGWMTKTNAEKESITDTEAEPDVTYEEGLGSQQAEDDGLSWDDWRRFFDRKSFFNNTVEDSERCKKIDLFKLKDDDGDLILADPEYKTLESYCRDTALVKAGDGSWSGFYKFKYKDGLETCLIDNFTYVTPLGVGYATGENRCWDTVKVPRSLPHPGMAYKMPARMLFYRVNSGCVSGKWASQQMIVDPETNFGGKKKPKGLYHDLSPGSRGFDRKNWNPYGSGQSSSPGGTDPYAGARDRLAYDPNPDAIRFNDDVVVSSSGTGSENNPLEKYTDYFDDITLI